MTRVILSAFVENEAGTLSRVAQLFSARGYNIESIAIAPTEDATLSQMTIVTYGDRDIIEQITKLMNRLVEVYKVFDITDKDHIERELMLVKVRAGTPQQREEMKRIADIFRARIVGVTDVHYIVEVTGHYKKLSAYVDAVGQQQIMEISRTGLCGIART